MCQVTSTKLHHQCVLADDQCKNTKQKARRRNDLVNHCLRIPYSQSGRDQILDTETGSCCLLVWSMLQCGRQQDSDWSAVILS